MSDAIDLEKIERLHKARTMNKVPLAQLDAMIKTRQEAALKGQIELVEYLNQKIRQLLGL